jgi:hypothetical protein
MVQPSVRSLKIVKLERRIPGLLVHLFERRHPDGSVTEAYKALSR